MLSYQLDFFIPGISPLLASSRKQILHILKSRIYPLFLPQRKQRRTMRVENFGFFLDLAITDVFAIVVNTLNLVRFVTFSMVPLLHGKNQSPARVPLQSARW
ncbi:MAG: hypothetical protein UW92_C0023G0010 [Candidatus Jorgensenbacteria bacterium GW2011_GWA2_45_13]|uniref:Uncharacterized protein n=1 Tax=Candidatus Jorgensenbacteria bacterium GW2011_GWA2_45_13 TaxID=1618662 RepID=A0A0G1L536_9BACT|nr:MAG: hypothetical protein UW92_C0023G0010 [Candidatus Jorgensenbacteria bacterium GW2011_GWA2_45_13]